MYPIYLDNQLATAPYKISDNLETLTKLYDNGKRSQSQVFSMLRGLGIDEQKATFAVENYMKNKKNNTYTMQITFEKSILVASGQSCVIYDKDICLGGGVVV